MLLLDPSSTQARNCLDGLLHMHACSGSKL